MAYYVAHNEQYLTELLGCESITANTVVFNAMIYLEFTREFRKETDWYDCSISRY